MIAYIWPIALVVLSNVVYQICAKSVPDGVSPFAALAVTYLVGAAVSIILYFVLGKGTASLVASSALAIILLFVGFLAYKEALTWNKLVGAAICLVGLFFINYKF